jgi:hypothetical protein
MMAFCLKSGDQGDRCPENRLCKYFPQPCNFTGVFKTLNFSQTAHIVVTAVAFLVYPIFLLGTVVALRCQDVC